MNRYDIGEEYSTCPSNGKKFQDDVLKPMLESGLSYQIDMNFAAYSSAFLKAAFHGLPEHLFSDGTRNPHAIITLLCEDASILDEVFEYLNEKSIKDLTPDVLSGVLTCKTKSIKDLTPDVLSGVLTCKTSTGEFEKFDFTNLSFESHIELVVELGSFLAWNDVVEYSTRNCKWI